MLGSVLLAVALGVAAYAAAEKKGRAPGGWLVIVMLSVMASYYAASLVAAGLADSNAIFSSSGGVLALAAVLAAPLAGLGAGGALVPVKMYGGPDGADFAELHVHLDRETLVVTHHGKPTQRVEKSGIETVTIDGNYLALVFTGSSTPLMLRASGDVPGGRDGRAELTKSLAARLGPTRP